MFIGDDAGVRECPEYFVTTRGLALLGDSQASPLHEPWGEQHALVIGSTTTACGERAGGWRFFPDRPFPEVASPTCRRCMVAVARVRGEILLSG